VVGRDGLRLAALLERQGVRGVGVELDRDQLGAQRDLRAERLRQQRRDLVVAAAHVVLLVGLPEDPQVAGAREAEQVEHVQRALVAGLGAVLDVVGDVEQLPEVRRDPAGHVGVDPVGDRHRIELAPALGREVVERRVAGREVSAWICCQMPLRSFVA
jgi:hypothetical protein